MLKTIGLRFRKVDILNFVSGTFFAVLLVLLVYMIVKQNMIIENNNFLTLLIDGKNKLIYYFIVALLEELIFRGLFLGLILKKGKEYIYKINCIGSYFCSSTYC